MTKEGEFFCQSGVLSEPDTSQYTSIYNMKRVCLSAGWPEFNTWVREHQLYWSVFEQLKLWIRTRPGNAFPTGSDRAKREFPDGGLINLPLTQTKRRRRKKNGWWETSAASRISSLWHLPAAQQTTNCHAALQGTSSKIRCNLKFFLSDFIRSVVWNWLSALLHKWAQGRAWTSSVDFTLKNSRC